MSFIGTKFMYKNISSDDMGVMLVRLESGMLNRVFGIQKTIDKEKIRSKDIPIYYNTEKQTYNISITICKINGNEPWTDEERLKISQWLFGDDEFHEFISEDNPYIIYPLQFIKGEMYDNYSGEGYIVLDSEMKTPYPYTRTSISQYDLTDNITTNIIEIENLSNVLDYYSPMFEVEFLDNTVEFKIKNLTISGEETIFSNLDKNEILCVDNLNYRIESSTGKERISNFNMKFLRLTYGMNRLEITGRCILTFKCSFPIMV